MNITTTSEFFKLIKHCIEEKIDRNGWQWSSADSRLLDWFLGNLEEANGK